MTNDELQELADLYGLYTRQDVDNEINFLKDLLNRSNLRLVEEQIKNEELKTQIEKMKCCENCKWCDTNCEGYFVCTANVFYDCKSNKLFDNKDSKINEWELVK